MIVQLSILFYSIQAIIVNPINDSCISQSQFSYEHVEQLNESMVMFKLKPFSKCIIQIDLRHLSQIPRMKNRSQACFDLKAMIKKQGSTEVENIEDLQTEINRYIFYIDQTAKLGIYFQIKQGYDAYKYLLYSSISIKVILENVRIPSEASSFLFIISNLKNLNLPINRPNVQQYLGYYIDKIKTKYESKLQEQTQSANSYWTTFNTIAIPFIPFISNCKNEINKLYLNQIMENQTDCTLIETDSTISIKQFQFGSSPTADTCKIERQCIYDEIPGIGSQFPFWMNLPKDTVLFQITQNKIDFKSYEITSNIDSSQLVQCKVNNSKGDNTTLQYPLNVKLTLQYYQIDQYTKKMISCSIDYSLYMESSRNFSYMFELQIKPLNHTYIMLAFGFEWYVYMIVFMIIGFISNIENLVLGMFHFCVSKKQKKELRFKIYLRVICQIFKGTIIALFLLVFILFAINLIMTGKVFEKKIYEANLATNIPRVFWDYMNSYQINDYDSQLAVQYRNGRTGYAFTITGACLIYLTSKFFIGCQKKQNQYNQYQVLGRQFKPRQWNHGRFIFGTYIYICIQFFFIYFAYSTVYSQNIWTFIVLMKVIQIVMQQITLSIYENLLPCLPFKVITDITAYMNTLSADNLYDFLFSFLIDVAMTMIEKAYVSQLQNMFVESIQKKVNQVYKFYVHLIDDTKGEAKQDEQNKSQQIEQQNQYVLLNGQIQEVNFFDNEEVEIHNDDNKIQLHQQRIKNLQKQISQSLLIYRRIENKKYAQKHSNNNDNQEPMNDKNQQQKIEESSMIFEILLDNILLLFTFTLQPFVILVFWVNYQQSNVLSNYGISYNVVILYLLSALVIAFFTIMNMVLIFHLLQSYLDIDFEEKIVSLLGRFLDRKIFWKSNDEDINNQIKMICRGADHYCLSWQFFFVLALYVGSMLIVMLGVSIIINTKYNPFKDSAMLIIGLFWSLFVCFVWWGVPKLVLFFNIDNCKQFEQKGSNLNGINDENLAYEIYEQEQKQKKQIRINLGSEDSQNQLLGVKLQEKKEERLKPKMFSLKLLMQLANAEAQQQQINGSTLQISESNLVTKVNTICKKLEPNFSNSRFTIEFFKKNKQFLKENIDKILPLMHQLPDINQYKIPKNQTLANDGAVRKETKTYDIFMEEVLNIWKYKCQSLQKARVKSGKDKQQGLTQCSFCFSPWGTYYGEPHTCLQCSIQIQRHKKNQ